MHIKNNTNPPYILRLRKRADFLRVRHNGKSVVTRSCIIQYAPMEQTAHMPAHILSDSVGIGFTATKKIGKATVRNRAKRRLRAIMYDKSLQLQSGYDIVLIARASTPHRSWENLVTDIKQGLVQAGLIYNQT